jgi:hypothetical protein
MEIIVKRPVGRPKKDETEKKKYDNRTYYCNFKDKHNTSIGVPCECGGYYSYFTKFNHLKTKRHTMYLLQKEITELKNDKNKE